MTIKTRPSREAKKPSGPRVLGMEKVLASPLFRPVLKEWALMILGRRGGNAFAWTISNWMVDPQDHEFRTLLWFFAGMLTERSWDYVRQRLPAHLPRRAAFEDPSAKFFYDCFKAELDRHLISWAPLAGEK